MKSKLWFSKFWLFVLSKSDNNLSNLDFSSCFVIQSNGFKWTYKFSKPVYISNLLLIP